MEIEKCHWSSSVILPGSSFKITEKLSKDKTKLNENVQSGNGEPWVAGLLFYLAHRFDLVISMLPSFHEKCLIESG